MTIGRTAAAFLVLLSPASAQSIIEPGRLPAAFRDFVARADEPKLACEVKPLPPALNFGLRFQAGFVVRVPLRQFEGKGHRWVMLMRIVPEGGERKPVYLASAVGLPEVPRAMKADGEVGGGFLLGIGKYAVDWLLTDEKGRVCRKTWRIDAHLKRSESQVKLATAPNTVAELSLRGIAKRPEPEDVRRLRLAILLHAAPVYTRRTRLRGSDRVLLLGTLSALLEQVPTSLVRLGVFNLDQQKVLLRDDNFKPNGFDRVAQAMNEVELGTVDYKVLRNPGGHLDLLADLVNRETAREKPVDAVIVLGPPARYEQRMPKEAVERPAADGPAVFNFQLQPYMRATATFPDVIANTVSRLKGKTVIIRNPTDFARAIGQLKARASERD